LYLEVKIINKVTRKPVPFVNILIENSGYGTSTNLEGDFSLKVPPAFSGHNNRLILSCIGYQTLYLSVRSLARKPKAKLMMTPATTQLNEMVIKGRWMKSKSTNVLRIVQRAFQRIPRNYPREDYMVQTFYRHYCRDNDVYGRLIEAAVEVYDPKGYKEFFLLPTEKVEMKVNQLRRSYDFTDEAQHQHTPIALNFILSNEITAYTYKNPFKQGLNRIVFEMKDTTVLDGQPVLVIGFSKEETNASHSRTFRGELYINAYNFAIVRVTSEFVTSNFVKYDSSSIALKRLQNYREFEGKYYINHLVSDGSGFRRRYDSSEVILNDWDHYAHVEMIMTNILPGKKPGYEGQEPTKKELLNINYDSGFWSNYNILEATPLELEIEQDLAQRAPLDQQFKTYNLVHSGGESILNSESFKKIIKEKSGKVVYVVIWSSFRYPDFFELTPIKYFEKNLRKEKAEYLFISVDENEEDWNQAREYQQLNLKYAKHHRISLKLNNLIAQKYYSNSFPMYILIDKNGKTVEMGAKPPSDPELKYDLKDLLRKKSGEPGKTDEELISQK